MAGRDRRANTPAQARNFLDAMRGLFRWAAKAKLVKSDPTIGVDNPLRPKTGGFEVWSEDDITHVDHCEIPNAYLGPWLHRIGPGDDAVTKLKIRFS
jgi:hypothetical protein